MSQPDTKVRRRNAFLALVLWLALFAPLSLLGGWLPFWVAALLGPAIFIAGLIGMRRLFRGYGNAALGFGFMTYIAAKMSLIEHRDEEVPGLLMPYFVPGLWFFVGIIVGDWICNDDSIINRIRQRWKENNPPPSDESGAGGAGSGTV